MSVTITGVDLQDIMSHHYLDIDGEEIFWVCENNMKSLANTLEKIITALNL